METSYFVQVTEGLVTDVRKTTAQYMSENPALYPGFWIEITSMDQYPALGWLWTQESGFSPPQEEV